MSQETQILKDAVREIKMLRTQNEFMAARLEMFDKCMLLFNTQPNCQSKGMSEGLTYPM